MLIFALTAIFAAGLGVVTAGPCPTGCSCNVGASYATCRNLNLTQPPDGYWPDIRDLSLPENKIVALDPYCLTGFPNLEYFTINGNALKELDLNTLATAPKLKAVRADNNNIKLIIPLKIGKQLQYLTELSFRSNDISTLAEGIFSTKYFPKLETLDMSYNPLVLPNVYPLVASETLRFLRLDHTIANNMSSKTFKELPNLVNLNLEFSEVSDIKDALSFMPKITNIFLGNNPLKAIRRGSFSKDQNIAYIQLVYTPLDTFETSAVNGVVMTTGILDISDSRLACECMYESLYWWAIAKKIDLYAHCGNIDCDFTRMKQ